jgi:predicted phosphodiesterase
MRTLVIGDTHFHNSNRALRHEQINCIRDLVQGNVCDNVVFLGDVFDKRSPSPECILDVIELFKGVKKNVFILRGNHDSASKADDGVTILSVLQRNAVFSSSGSVRVFEKPTVVNFTDGTYHFIPHYEDQTVIQNELANSPEGAVVFGHFGFDGALNNAGDADCDIGSDQFNNLTILGHIHQHTIRGNIKVLGTPYSTCFHDGGDKFYGIIKDGEIYIEEMDTGPIHLTLTPRNLTALNDYENRYTLVRLMLERDDMDYNIFDLKQMYPHVNEWDIRYVPTYDEEELSSYKAEAGLFQVNDQIIDDYIGQASTIWSKEELKAALSELRDED